MTRRVFIAKEANEELDATALYLAERRSMDLALRFYAQADATFQRLLESAHIGRRRHFRSPRLANVRSWRVNEFAAWLIFYVPEDTGIGILHVLHGRQQLDRILGEET